MVLQQDKGSAPHPFDTGLPRVQSSEDVPRWLIVFGAVAACTLLVALLRYAIDLLGVVFLIILVGFSIRAISDWLTEGESVSGWALAAVFAGLIGTVIVGLWLFGSRDIASGAFERGIPAPVLAVNEWLESHGWGQRVLLGGSGSTSPPPAEQARAAPGVSPSAPAARPSAAAPAQPSNPPPESSPEPAPLRKAPPRAAPGSTGGEAEAATARPSPPPGQPRESGAGESPTPRVEPTTQPAADPATSTAAAEPVSFATSTSLSSSHSSSVVGTSVRFTASVTAEGGGVPVGVVVFYDGDRTLGTAPVRGNSATVTVVLVTLGLAIGDHEIAAEFHGSHGFLGSRSPSLTQSVSRR